VDASQKETWETAQWRARVCLQLPALANTGLSVSSTQPFSCTGYIYIRGNKSCQTLKHVLCSSEKCFLIQIYGITEVESSMCAYTKEWMKLIHSIPGIQWIWKDITVGNVQCIQSLGTITKYKAVYWYSEILYPVAQIVSTCFGIGFQFNYIITIDLIRTILDYLPRIQFLALLVSHQVRNFHLGVGR